ncbi:chitinase [Ochrobactrum sp. BTU1]|uniref:chitinase n=1 Tax=Ochrobactrum sp. BTU1 TaxID=2840456 RepID=UPI001C043560|nr:chitinase [Ochrobactrum sp. BTU1]
MNKATFFAYARRAPFGGRLSQADVSGTEAVFADAERKNLPDEQIAHILAMVFHETGGKMQPVVKYLNYSSAARIRQVWPKRFSSIAAARPYVINPQTLANKVYGGGMGNDSVNDGWTYRGRGLKQITGEDNYKEFGIADAPEKALEPRTAICFLFEEMVLGKFTDRKLTDFFGKGKADPEGARTVVKGTDKAMLIAGYYRNFLDSLLKHLGI